MRKFYTQTPVHASPAAAVVAIVIRVVVNAATVFKHAARVVTNAVAVVANAARVVVNAAAVFKHAARVVANAVAVVANAVAVVANVACVYAFEAPNLLTETQKKPVNMGFFGSLAAEWRGHCSPDRSG